MQDHLRENGKEKHRPLLCGRGVCARTSADGRYALLFAGSLLCMVSEQADINSETRGEKKSLERTCMDNF